MEVKAAMKLSRLTLAELLDEYERSFQDAVLCCVALDRGRKYDCFGQPIRARRNDDLEYVLAIRREIERRCGGELKLWAMDALRREG